MESWLSPWIEHGASSLIDSDVACVDNVERPSGPKSEDSKSYLSGNITCKDKSLLNGWHLGAILLLKDILNNDNLQISHAIAKSPKYDKMIQYELSINLSTLSYY